MKTKIIIAISTILLFLSAAGFGQEMGYGEGHEGRPRFLLCKQHNGEKAREAKILSCPAPSAPDASEWKCERILIRAAKILKKNPDATLVMVGGDDSDGEYLTSLGIDPKRISEKPSSGRLVLIIRFAPKPNWDKDKK